MQEPREPRPPPRQPARIRCDPRLELERDALTGATNATMRCPPRSVVLRKTSCSHLRGTVGGQLLPATRSLPRPGSPPRSAPCHARLPATPRLPAAARPALPSARVRLSTYSILPRFAIACFFGHDPSSCRRALTQFREEVHQSLQRVFCAKTNLSIEVPHHSGVVGGCDMRSVKAEAVQPHELAGVATVLHNQRASFAVSDTSDDVIPGAELRRSPNAQRLLDQRAGLAACVTRLRHRSATSTYGLPSSVCDPINKSMIRSRISGSPIATASATARTSASSRVRVA